MTYGFTPEQCRIIFKLLNKKNIEIDHITGISTQIEGTSNSISNTIKFLTWLVKQPESPFEIFTGTEKTLGIFNGVKNIKGKEYIVYKFKKDKLINIYKNSINYKVAELIQEKEKPFISIGGVDI